MTICVSCECLAWFDFTNFLVKENSTKNNLAKTHLHLLRKKIAKSIFFLSGKISHFFFVLKNLKVSYRRQEFQICNISIPIHKYAGVAQKDLFDLAVHGKILDPLLCVTLKNTWCKKHAALCKKGCSVVLKKFYVLTVKTHSLSVLSLVVSYVSTVCQKT